MWKHSAHLLYTGVAALLFVWTILEWVRIAVSIFDRLSGYPVQVDVCRYRRRMYDDLAREFGSMRDNVPTSSYAYLRPFDRDGLAALDTYFAHLRSVASKFQRARCRGLRPPRFYYYYSTTGHYNIEEEKRAFIEWGLTSRYPTDGPLLFILSILGTFHQHAVSFDDARADGSAYVNVALSRVFHLKSTSVHSSWSAVRAERLLYPYSYSSSVAPERVVTQFFQHNTPPLVRADVLALFLETGREEDVLRDVRARILVAHYRDFLGIDDALSLVAPNGTRYSSTAAATHRNSGLDPTRPVPKYGHNLPALTRLAASHGFRLVWCIRRYPVAIFLHQSTDLETFFPTLPIDQCYKHRSKAAGFRQDMEALWDLADGRRWLANS